MNKKSIYWGIVFSTIMSAIIFFLGYGYDRISNVPHELYQVYLDGKVVGVINNENELYNLIDKEQKELKDDYNVNKIYPPNNLEISKVVTFNETITPVKDIYEKIKDKEPFTVKGYEVTIDKLDEEAKDIKLYILNKDDLDVAVNATIRVFVSPETYEAYLNGTQETKFEEGSILEKVELDDKIIIKDAYIPTEEKIYRDAEELSRYMLFGTEEVEKSYTIKTGDTIKSVAVAHNLNVTEFLIVNPEIKGENALLFPGQVVNVASINPLITIVTDYTVVENQKVPFETEVKYDSSMPYGMSTVEQAGVEGVTKYTFKIQSKNGVSTSAVKISSQELSAPVNEIVVKGGVNIIYVGDSTYWAWPTLPGYVLMDYYGWRIDPVYGGRAFHSGIDISGTGYGSPIFAIQSGVVVKKGWGGTEGNFVEVDHQNGYYSLYLHLAQPALVNEGDKVIKGQTIGLMGSTGKSTGTHLHLSVYYGGNAYANLIDPFLIYQ